VFSFALEYMDKIRGERMTPEVVLMCVLIGIGVALLPKILKVLIAIVAGILGCILLCVAVIMGVSVNLWRRFSLKR
tara:strand:+ start:3072 stop:3299 length:228 start_codon:yes stop_codon:yes gene_type:complete